MIASVHLTIIMAQLSRLWTIPDTFATPQSRNIFRDSRGTRNSESQELHSPQSSACVCVCVCCPPLYRIGRWQLEVCFPRSFAEWCRRRRQWRVRETMVNYAPKSPVARSFPLVRSGARCARCILMRRWWWCMVNDRTRVLMSAFVSYCARSFM